MRASSIKAPNNMNNFCPNRNVSLDSIKSSKNETTINEMFNRYFNNKMVDRECVKQCPLECKTEKFDITITNSMNKY